MVCTEREPKEGCVDKAGATESHGRSGTVMQVVRSYHVGVWQELLMGEVMHAPPGSNLVMLEFLAVSGGR